jgi:hypothetical protein
MRMQATHFLTCLWPGLAEIWWRGRLSALPAAIAFGFALNGLLITRYLYPQWIPGILVQMACWVALAAWIFYVIRRVRELPGLLSPRSVSDEPDCFADAQIAYLRADWLEARRLLQKVLAIEPRDPPALLLLAAVYRQTEYLEQARLLLQEIERLEIADPWQLEVQAEQLRLERAEQLRLERAEQAHRERASDSTSADLTAA